MNTERACIAIDLKSFYASVECIERGLDPMTENLVVADESRTEKTICLAVSPSLRSLGVPGRARLFEVNEKVRQINSERLSKAPGRTFRGESTNITELERDPSLKLAFRTAVPRMGLYIQRSSEIYTIYLSYIAPEDMHVYSVDEVFIEASPYLSVHHATPEELAVRIIHDIYEKTGITATCGIGTNLYLAKVAMDIVAKHMEPDEKGVRLAVLDEAGYRKLLWNHRPLTDFWRVGKGYRDKLEANGLFTMGDIARCSLGKPGDFYNEELLYRLFGINAELLIDHAWGYEPCRISDIKAYVPESSSVSSGQVLQYPYDAKKARVIVHEMTDSMVLGLVEKSLVTDQIVLTIGYDIENLSGNKESSYVGEVKNDWYGRKVPKAGHGTANLGSFSSSGRLIVEKTLELYDRIVDPKLLIRRITLNANHLMKAEDAPKKTGSRQLDLFTDPDLLEKQQAEEKAALEKEKRLQEAELAIKKRFGKNALIKGLNLEEGATAMDRNKQIGGHKL